MSGNIEIVEAMQDGSYNSQRAKERKEIIEALQKGVEIRFFYNFIEIGNKTYNGWDRWAVKKLKESLESEKEKK